MRILARETASLLDHQSCHTVGIQGTAAFRLELLKVYRALHWCERRVAGPLKSQICHG